jgi:two-component system capsular synthesis response regulator RcsB
LALQNHIQAGAVIDSSRKIRLHNGKKTTLMLLDDHPVVSMGTSALLSAQQDMQVEGAFGQVDALLQALARQQCDVVLLDFHLGSDQIDGETLVRRLRNQYPELIILVYTSDVAPQTEYAVWRAGANGLLCKRTDSSWLAEMVRAARGRPLCFHGLRDATIATYVPRLEHAQLSISEIEVLRQLAQGLTVGQVAQRLHRSKQTVSSHKRSAMHKLQLADDLSLALYLERRFTF